MNLITNLGDLVVLLPASVGLVFFLARFGARQDALAFVAAAAVCVAGALIAKLALAACGQGHAIFDVESPSGHAALAATFYGCLAALFGAGRAIAARLALYGAAAALILMIAMSRVALEAHTVPEVVAGLFIGAASVALFQAVRVKPERLELTAEAMMRMSPFAVIFALCWLLLAGRWTAEPYIDALAAQFGVGLHLCK
jgi:membrane-associated phospholipid phosphatase